MECMRNHFNEDVLLDGRFKTVSPLNHGSFGMVFKAQDMVTGEYVALKCITKTSAANFCPSVIAIDDCSEELTIHERIGYHPNIVNLLHSFETEHHIYLVLEFCPNGDLYEAIRLGKGPLETEHVRDFMLQLVDAVEHMHSKGLYHRDLKPENIFLTQSGSMKLGDFGLATTEHWSYEAAVGSDRYMAPEQFDPAGTGYSPAKADTWAIGICLLNILFSRNPFAMPTESDPLYRDFFVDRQSLFDVFPNMSQDTFGVLIQCLGIEPSSRSLSGVREALKRVISFTTDDEMLDEFCNADRDVVTATANREPLRTPSLSSPQVDQGGAFPWQKALASYSRFPRKLSAIPQTPSEDLFPESERSSGGWSSVKPDSASVISFVDSGLGVSLKSTIDIPKAQSISVSRSRPVQIAGSLPVSAARPIPSIASVFSKKETVSKSWSDMYDEEEEENAFQVNGGGFLAKVRSRESMFSGRSTPRAVPQRTGLSEVKNPATMNNRRDRSPENRIIDDSISEQTGFFFEDHATPPTPRYSPPKRTMADRWAALGDRRRGNEKPASEKTSTDKFFPSKSNGRKRTRTGSWRRNNNGAWTQQPHSEQHNNTNNMHGVRERGKDRSLSKDWRRHGGPPTSPPNKHFYSSTSHHDDIGADIEWVGGWHDLHL